MADFRLVSGRGKETRDIVLNRDERTMRVLLALEVNVSYSTSYLNAFHPTIKGSRLYHSNCSFKFFSFLYVKVSIIEIVLYSK